MLPNILFILLQLILLFNYTSSNTLESNESLFLKNVKQFYLKTNSKELISETSKYFNSLSEDQNGEENIIEIFKRDLLLILQQLLNYYVGKLPNRKFVNNYKVLGMKVIHKISKLTKYELTICKHLPRCLNFINICQTESKSLMLLYELHSLLCESLPNFLKNCTLDLKDNAVYQCDNIIVYNYYKLKSFTTIKDIYMQDDYQNISMEFISNIYSIINGINDKEPMIKNNSRIRDNIFDHVIPLDLKIISSVPGYEKKTISRVKNLKLKEENTNYFKSLTNECDASSGLSIDDVATWSIPIPSAINKLLLYTYKRLEKHYKFKLYTYDTNIITKNESKFYQDDIKTLMSEMFDKLCKYLPKILLYLMHNDVPKNSREHFGLYFTLCGDYMDFFNTNCPSTDIISQNQAYDQVCIIESIRDKILKNFFLITDNISEYDKYILDECTNGNYDYIKNIYDIVSECYEGLPVPFWTSYTWLSKKYIFTDRYNSIGMNEVQQHIMNIKGTEMTLSNVFYKLLPWHSDSITVLTFNIIVFEKLDKMLNTYIYRHARLIILYFNKKKNKVPKKELEALKKSIELYKHASNIFYKYLCLPYAVKPINNIITIVTEIENITQSRKIKNLEKAIPLSVMKVLKRWSDTKIPNIKEKDFLKKFNNIARENSNDAIEFINDVISVINKSKLFENEEDIKTLTTEQWCINVFNV